MGADKSRRGRSIRSSLLAWAAFVCVVCLLGCPERKITGGAPGSGDSTGGSAAISASLSAIAGLASLEVIFDVKVSATNFDHGVGGLGWSLDFGDGSTTGPYPGQGVLDPQRFLHTYEQNGSYTAKLTTSLGASPGPTEELLVVLPPVSASLGALANLDNLSVLFDVEVSATNVDPDLGGLGWSLGFGDGSTTGPYPNQGVSDPQRFLHTYGQAGTYKARLTTTVGITQGPTEERLVVLPPLSASLTPTPTMGAPPLDVSFRVAASATNTDPNLGGLGWSLDFGDGSAPVTGPGEAGEGDGTATVTHTYEQVGTYTARLTTVLGVTPGPTVEALVTVSPDTNGLDIIVE